MAENDDFQGFSEDLSGTPRRISVEMEEVIADMERRYERIQRAKLTYGRNMPRTLREEEEMLRANIAHMKRRHGLD